MLREDGPVLVLAPHTDDGELGCGGAIARFRRQGRAVLYHAFCTCDESLPAGFPKGTLHRELMAATAELGLTPEAVTVGDFAVRRLSDSRQEVLDELVRLNREHDPQIVFCPTTDDLHQDHAVVAAEARRAFKTKTLLGYEMPWNNVTFHANFLIRLSEADIEAKLAALARYTSQGARPYLSPRFIRSLAHARGVTAGVEYAEAFTLFRAVH